jgi:hypothetical protein
VDAGQRLVEEQDLGTAEKRPGESDAMDLADRSVGAFFYAGITGRLEL